MKVKRLCGRLLSLLLAAALLAAAFPGALAAGGHVKGYLVLGEDLTGDALEEVLEQLGVDDLSAYEVTTVSLEEEAALFGDYLSDSELGSQALVAVLLVPSEEGSGISVTVSGIEDCAEELYQSALADAGVQDVQVSVAGAEGADGIPALTGILEAYAEMTGTELDEEAVDAAARELAAAGRAALSVGGETAAKLLTALKEKVLDENLTEEQVGAVLDELCENMGVTLTEERRQELIEAVVQLKDVDIDLEQLRQQTSDLFASIRGELAKLEESGAVEQGKGILAQLFEAIASFFQSLFAGLFGGN